jgi:hypothetical protein
MRGSRNFQFDRVVKGVGRIRCSAGTASLREYHRRDGILTKLIEQGSLETLRLLKAGQLTIQDLVDADRHDRVLRVADRLKLHKPLEAAIDAWLPNSAAAPQSRRRYKVGWERFQKHAKITSASPVGELARIDYKKLHRYWGASDTDWNRTRATLSAFLTHYLGHVHHSFRLEVMGLYKTRREPEGRVPTLDAKGFWKFIDGADERCKASFVTMVLLLTGPAEYLSLTREDLDPVNFMVHVRGTKNVVRDQWVGVEEEEWPWIDAGVPSQLQDRWLRVYFNKARDKAKLKDFRMYDLRHFGAQLAGDAGVSDRDLTVHLRHTNPKMSHRYSRRLISRKAAKGISDMLRRGRKTG